MDVSDVEEDEDKEEEKPKTKKVLPHGTYKPVKGLNMAHVRQSMPEHGTCKIVKARTWHIYKTVKTRTWHI